jgi:hypothetical protein
MADRPPDRPKFKMLDNGALRWLWRQELRVIDSIAIGVIAALLAAGGIWVISVAASNGHEAGAHHPPLQRAGRGKAQTSHVEGEAGLARPVYVDDLLRENGSPIEPGPVSIGGRRYEHGLRAAVNWIESEWEASYLIPHGARTFSTIIGNDDEQSDSLWTSMSLLYEVLADGKLVGSGHAKGYAHDGPIHSDVAGKITLTLRVKAVSGLNSTNADWAEPVFR